MNALPPPWTSRAACTPFITRGDDYWHPDDDWPARIRAAMFAAGRSICVVCPVQAQCGRLGLELVETEGAPGGMFGGMTPDELREIARAIGRPARKVAQHGTRSRYVGRGKCRCAACRRANATAENRRRKGIAA